MFCGDYGRVCWYYASRPAYYGISREESCGKANADLAELFCRGKHVRSESTVTLVIALDQFIVKNLVYASLVLSQLYSFNTEVGSAGEYILSKPMEASMIGLIPTANPS